MKPAPPVSKIFFGPGILDYLAFIISNPEPPRQSFRTASVKFFPRGKEEE
jgi:hypothetical protein